MVKRTKKVDRSSVEMAGYPGSKAAGGVAEKIIGQFPPHEIYVEPFAGHAAVFRRKKAASLEILNDKDPKVFDRLEKYLEGETGNYYLYQLDFWAFVEWIGVYLQKTTLVYLDPPYLGSTRTKKLYQHEMMLEEEHARLLVFAKKLPCMVAISCYDNPLYQKELADWRKISFPAQTRGGPRVETLYMNFPEPTELHDPRYAGGDYRERERIKRKGLRLAEKISSLAPRERQAVLTALANRDPASLEMALRASKDHSADTSKFADSAGPIAKNGDGIRKGVGGC